MKYYEAALRVLKSAQRPLTTQEVTDRAIENGFIVPRGKTPLKTMAAALYVGRRHEPRLVKLDEGKGSTKTYVRWILRKD